MELQGLAQDASVIFKAHIQSVRLFTRDFAELNLLIRGEESSDRMIAWATLDFLSDFNGSPPFTGFRLEDLYNRQLGSFAVRGTVVSLLQSLMLIYTRNHLPFSDGGISVDLNNKAGTIMQMLSLMQSAYEQNKIRIKTTFNIEALLDINSGGLFSEYSTLTTLGYYS